LKYRSRSQIITEILRVAEVNGATKMNIMYKAFLSYTQLKEYLEFLQASEMIQYLENDRLYRVTEKGKKLLQAYVEIDDMMSSRSIGKTEINLATP
jgi:predicted transcriptional regulator